eukprot:6194220-Pleurochrysis_carterae.AAC.1
MDNAICSMIEASVLFTFVALFADRPSRANAPACSFASRLVPVARSLASVCDASSYVCPRCCWARAGRRSAPTSTRTTSARASGSTAWTSQSCTGTRRGGRSMDHVEAVVCVNKAAVCVNKAAVCKG